MLTDLGQYTEQRLESGWDMGLILKLVRRIVFEAPFFMDKLNPRQGSKAWHISKTVEDAAKSRTRLPNMGPVLYQRYNEYAKNSMVIRCTILERHCMPPVVRSPTTKGVGRKRSMEHCREATSSTIFSLPRSLDFTTRPRPLTQASEHVAVSHRMEQVHCNTYLNLSTPDHSQFQKYWVNAKISARKILNSSPCFLE
jgi:hypothetical protein